MKSFAQKASKMISDVHKQIQDGEGMKGYMTISASQSEASQHKLINTLPWTSGFQK